MEMPIVLVATVGLATIGIATVGVACLRCLIGHDEVRALYSLRSVEMDHSLQPSLLSECLQLIRSLPWTGIKIVRNSVAVDAYQESELSRAQGLII